MRNVNCIKWYLLREQEVSHSCCCYAACLTVQLRARYSSVLFFNQFGAAKHGRVNTLVGFFSLLFRFTIPTRFFYSDIFMKKKKKKKTRSRCKRKQGKNGREKKKSRQLRREPSRVLLITPKVLSPCDARCRHFLIIITSIRLWTLMMMIRNNHLKESRCNCLLLLIWWWTKAAIAALFHKPKENLISFFKK